MDAHEYSDGYSYSLDPNAMYLTDPMMLSQQAYCHQSQGHQWGWPNQGYNPMPPPPQFYGSYPQMPVGYGYGFNNEAVMYSQQTFQSNDNQEQSGKRSKYSYSQNRTRNRVRADYRQNNNSQTSASQSSNQQPVNSSLENGAKVSLNEQENNQASASNCEAKFDDKVDNCKLHERLKTRGGRFQGSDSRSKPFDKEKQKSDRQKGYNKVYISKSENETLAEAHKSDDRIAEPVTETRAFTTDSSNGARPKSSKGSRDKEHNDNRENTTRDKALNKAQNYKENRNLKGERGNNRSHGHRGNDIENKSKGEYKEDRWDSVGRDGGGRKKKKEYQVSSYLNTTFFRQACSWMFVRSAVHPVHVFSSWHRVVCMIYGHTIPGLLLSLSK